MNIRALNRRSVAEVHLPGVTGVVPAFTEAVSVTTLPEATVVAALPPEVTARVAAVAVFVCADAA